MAFYLTLVSIFSILATVSALELTYSKADENRYLGTGPKNYALSGSTLAGKGFKTVSVNGDSVSLITPWCQTTISSMQLLAGETKHLIEDLRKEGLSYNEDSSDDQTLVYDDDEKQFLKTKIPMGLPNNSLITLRGNIKLFSLTGFPESLSRILIDGSVVSFINDDGTVTMKPIACLSEEERLLVYKVDQVSSTSGDADSQGVGALQRESSERQTGEAANANQYGPLESRLRALEGKVKVFIESQMEQNDYLFGNFSELRRQTEAWERIQSESYAELRSKLDRELDLRHRKLSEEYSQLRSKLERESDLKHRQLSEEYSQLKSKLERESDLSHGQLSEEYSQLKSKLERESDLNHKFNIEQYQKLKDKIERESDLNHKFNIEQYQKLKDKIERESDSWIKRQNEKYEQLRYELETKRQ